VQVNGKKRATCTVPAEVDQASALTAAAQAAAKYLEGKQIIKQIFIPHNKLVNIVVK
jgi:leucyl-tRNA synthetase